MAAAWWQLVAAAWWPLSTEGSAALTCSVFCSFWSAQLVEKQPASRVPQSASPARASCYLLLLSLRIRVEIKLEARSTAPLLCCVQGLDRFRSPMHDAHSFTLWAQVTSAYSHNLIGAHSPGVCAATAGAGFLESSLTAQLETAALAI